MGLSVRASAQQTKWIVAHWTTVVDGLGVEVSPLKTRAHVHRSEESTGLYPSLVSPATAAGEGYAKAKRSSGSRGGSHGRDGEAQDLCR
jgi:hypothetical protein